MSSVEQTTGDSTAASTDPTAPAASPAARAGSAPEPPRDPSIGDRALGRLERARRASGRSMDAARRLSLARARLPRPGERPVPAPVVGRAPARSTGAVRPVPYGQPGHTTAPITRMAEGTAIVFEGGGMRGVYTAALVQVLLEAGVAFPWVGGISAGSTNVVNMVSRDLWRTREAYIGLTTDPLTGGWGSFARRRGYFNSEHIYHHTSEPDEAIPFDWPAFKSSPSTVRIGAFRIDTGEEVYWGLEDMETMADLLPRCQASSSMPVLMPTAYVDGAPYLDGALGPTGGWASDAARADGYTRMLAVSTRPKGYVKPPEKRPEALRRFFRRTPLVAEAVIDRPQHYNAEMERLLEGQRAGDVYLFQPERMFIENGELRYDRVVAAYEAGLVQARRELPAILEFLGV